MPFSLKVAKLALFAMLLSTQVAQAGNGPIEECDQIGKGLLAPNLPQDIDREIVHLLHSWTAARTFTSLPALPQVEIRSRLKLLAGKQTDESIELAIQDQMNKAIPAAACLEYHLRANQRYAIIKSYGVVTLPLYGIAAAIKLQPGSNIAVPGAPIYISRGRERAIYFLNTQTQAFSHLPFDTGTPQIDPNRNPYVALWDAVYSSLSGPMERFRQK